MTVAPRPATRCQPAQSREPTRNHALALSAVAFVIFSDSEHLYPAGIWRRRIPAGAVLTGRAAFMR